MESWGSWIPEFQEIKLYWQVSYSILHKVSPVTHSVGNSLKRVVVIVSSIIFFQTPVSTINALGKL